MKTPRKRPPPRLTVHELGPIHQASVTLADLTILVGPQASGKSIFLQALELAIDHPAIIARLRREGLDWHGDAPTLLDLYFGEGMRTIWGAKTIVQWQLGAKRMIDPAKLAKSRSRALPSSSVFYVPAHRALTLKNGWPRHFGDYSPGDPFVVRHFSETLRNLMESSGSYASVFQQGGKPLTTVTRELIQQGVFGDYELRLDTSSPQKRLVLQRGAQPPLPFMVWSAGQRELSPLLIGLDWLMPKATDRRAGIEWVIIEEPEMGLHPKAITTVLLLLLELLRRGYRVCLSTHSPHILDLVWALRVFREKGAGTAQILELFGMKRNAECKKLAADVLQRSVSVYYFDRNHGQVTDISRLDPDSSQAPETTWGGLIEWSARVSDTVADFVANSQDSDGPRR